MNNRFSKGDVKLMNKMIKECDELIKKLGDMPFEEGLPLLKKGFSEIANEYNTSGIEAFKKYLEWEKLKYRKSFKNRHS